jgi:hypothetical protein
MFVAVVKLIKSQQNVVRKIIVAIDTEIAQEISDGTISSIFGENTFSESF